MYSRECIISFLASCETQKTLGIMLESTTVSLTVRFLIKIPLRSRKGLDPMSRSSRAKRSSLSSIGSMGRLGRSRPAPSDKKTVCL